MIDACRTEQPAAVPEQGPGLASQTQPGYLDLQADLEAAQARYERGLDPA